MLFLFHPYGQNKNLSRLIYIRGWELFFSTTLMENVELGNPSESLQHFDLSLKH